MAEVHIIITGTLHDTIIMKPIATCSSRVHKHNYGRQTALIEMPKVLHMLLVSWTLYHNKSPSRPRYQSLKHVQVQVYGH